MRKFGKQAVVGAAAVALGTVAFTGSAMAWDNDVHGTGGSGGNGGKANANCLIPVGVTAGIVGQGGNNSQCNASGGAAGNGGAGVTY